jgi:hypothetical protein
LSDDAVLLNDGLLSEGLTYRYSVIHLESDSWKDIPKFGAIDENINMKLLREMKNMLRFGVLISEIALFQERHSIFSDTCVYLEQ